MKVIAMSVSDEGNNHESVIKVITTRVSDEGINYESV